MSMRGRPLLVLGLTWGHPRTLVKPSCTLLSVRLSALGAFNYMRAFNLSQRQTEFLVSSRIFLGH